MVALSVSISAITSPAETLSPFFFFHATSVPSVIVSLNLGIWISGMAGWFDRLKRCGLKRSQINLASTLHRFIALRITNFFDRGDELLLVRQNCLLQSFVVWHGYIFLRDAHNRCVELVENIFLDPITNFCAHATEWPVLFYNHHPMRFRD